MKNCAGFARAVVTAGALTVACGCLGSLAHAQSNPQGGRTPGEEAARQREHDAEIHRQNEEAGKYHSNASDTMNTKTVTPAKGTASDSNYVPVLNKPYVRQFEPNVETAAEKHFIGLRQRGEYAELGDCYYYGRDVAVDKSMAFGYYEEAARKSPHAGFVAGKMRFTGDGVWKSEYDAYPLLKSAAERGDADATAFLREHPEPKRHIGEFPKMEVFAEDGYAARGVGVQPVKPDEVAKLKTELARVQLKNVPPGKVKARGDEVLRAAVAEMYGSGVPQDMEAANDLFSLAEYLQVDGAAEYHAWLAWKRASARPLGPGSSMLTALNDGHAHTAESEYLRALAFDREPTDRFGWLIRASRDGYMPATTDLGIALLEGNGCNPDAGWGLGELQRAADAGNRNAKYVLGLIYDRGDLGVIIDHEKASQLLRAAAKDGQPDAKKRLEEGFGNLVTAGRSEPPE